MKTVRELSAAGPCITLGLVLRETAWRISYRDRHGTSKFISTRWAVHTEPCPLCPDHPKTKYPDGYWDWSQQVLTVASPEHRRNRRG